MATKTKTRVGVVLREKMMGAGATSRSADLVNFTEKYHEWRKRMRSMIQALEKYHGAMIHIDQTRTQVTKQLALFAQQTPLWSCTGLMPSADNPSTTVCSYASTSDVLSTKTRSYVAKYKQFVIDYALEWEKVVTSRVDTGIKKAEELRRELDHYRKKVEELRTTTTRNMTKGKQIKPELQDKLRRNEEKLQTANQTYNKEAHGLCTLIEEVTERGWRDLHPLLVKVAQFDMTLSQDEAQILSGLSHVVSKLKEVADAEGIAAQPRLKDVAEKKPEELSTRPGGVTGPKLSIESNLSPSMSGVTSSSSGHDDMARPPGTVAPQGIGGFPVRIADSGPPDGGPERGSSFHSNQSEPPMTTMGMLTIKNNAAPAPTMEDVYAAQSGDNDSTYSAGAFSAPVVMGGNPPNRSGSGHYPPSRNTSGVYGRTNSSSLDDAGSVYSQLSLGSAQAPPPPPSMPPPPPPSMPPPPPPEPSYDGTIVLSVISPTSAYSYPPPPPPPSYATPTPYGGSYRPPPPPGSYGGNYEVPPLPSGYGDDQNPFGGGNYGPPPPPSYGPPRSDNPNNPFG